MADTRVDGKTRSSGESKVGSIVSSNLAAERASGARGRRYSKSLKVGKDRLNGRDLGGVEGGAVLERMRHAGLEGMPGGVKA